MIVAYLLGALTPFAVVAGFLLARDTLALYRTVLKYGGEDPKILSRAGRVVQRILQALTGRHRKE